MAEQEQIEGLPAGATLRPISQGIEGLPAGAVLRPIAAEPHESPAQEEPGYLSQAGTALKDVGIGAVKGMGNTVAGTASLLGKIPVIGKTLSPPEGTTALKAMSEPTDTAQKVGYYGEQIGEFMLPGEAEEAGALKLASKAPMLGKYALPLAKLGTTALSSGTVNALQGGDFGTGAAAGVGGSLIAKGVESAAPKIIERAIGVGPKQLMYGAKPGEEALKLPGLTAGALKSNAGQKALDLTANKLEPLLQQADQAGTMIDLAPARTKLQDAMAAANKRNSPTVAARLQPLLDQLTTDASGNAIPSQLPPTQARALKQGIDDTIGSWTSERGGISKRVTSAAKAARSAIDQNLDAAIPGHDELNSQIQSLISASKGRGAGRMGILGNRVVLPLLGYQVARTEGASPAESIGAGLAMEGLTSPTARIMAAKGLPKVLPAARAAALQAFRNNGGQ